MNHEEAGRYWNRNAEAWTVLVRAGFDIYRDLLNTPAFFSLLPDVKGLTGLDIGCGEGHNTRLLGHQGALMTAIDIADVFIAKAKEWEAKEPLQIQYAVGSAVALPFENNSFDFATSFMCLMDIPELKKALAEAYRVIRPGGFFQFSISHPCFDTPVRKNKKDFRGKTYAIEVSDYFKNIDGQIEEWIFGAAPAEVKRQFAKFQVPKFSRTLSHWINDLAETGFLIERMQEPCPGEELVKQHPRLRDAASIPYFLQVRCRKPL